MSAVFNPSVIRHRSEKWLLGYFIRALSLLLPFANTETKHLLPLQL
jgi:hypothetical protein